MAALEKLSEQQFSLKEQKAAGGSMSMGENETMQLLGKPVSSESAFLEVSDPEQGRVPLLHLVRSQLEF